MSRCIMGYVLLKLTRDHRQPAGHSSRSVNDADPVCARLAVKWPRIVVDSVGQKLERRPLGWRVAVLHSLEITTGRELRWMASDAELGLGMLHYCAQRYRAAAWGIRKPRVAHVDQEIHARAHGLMRSGVGRHAVFVGVQLKSRVISGHANVVFLARFK